ncbi:MAG: drug/metabolite exporter YedA [Actinomycetota bacterium]|nr:drug/metabolite exporter YedA [Actinomycetota bacterium]
MKTSTQQTSRTEAVSVTAALFAVYVVWGSTYLAIRFAVESLPPLLMSGIRFLIAGGLMYAWLRFRGSPAPTRSQWRAVTMIGALMLVGGVGVVAIAEDVGVGSGVAATAIAAVPLWAAFWARVLGERTTRLEAVGLIVGFVGVAVLATAGDLTANPLGALLILLAPISWAFGSVWSKRLDLPQGAMATAAQMLAGGVLLLLVGYVSGERISQAPSASSWLALAYLIVFGSIVAYTSYMYLLRTVRPALATSYAYANPVVAVFLGVTLGSEVITGRSLAALPVILVGVGLLASGRTGAIRRRRSVPTVDPVEAPCTSC